MRAVAALCLVAACGFDHGAPALRGDGGGSDGGDATMIDSPPGCTTYSTQFDTCAIGFGLGTMDLALSGMNTYDTDTGTLVTPAGVIAVPHQIVTTSDGPIDVIFVAKFTLQANATLRVTGPNNDRPFGIASVGAVQISGRLDLAVNGAGARDDANCSSDGVKGGNDAAGGAGGGGAGFGAAGGGGANGNGNGTQSTGGAAGAATTRPAHILGGCDGGDGGDSAVAGGVGGDGGGAVFIATPTTIAIGNMGAISAGGGGGKTGTGAAAGGGGGGSGGFILLEATSIMNGGILAANGGGGGEGAGLGVGRDGEDAHLSTMKANGGTGGDAQGGNAADGGAGSNGAGSTATDVQNGGGGGGGGGVGFIATTVVPTSMGPSIISPPRQAWP